METRLGSIKDFVQSFADIISNTVDADVIIVDNNYVIVGAAFRYFTLYNKIKEGSIMYEVLTMKKTVVVEDKNRLQKCNQCKEFDTCKMVGMVGVPIFYDTYVIGAIALMLPKHRVKALFQTIDTSVAFVENMAEQIAQKVKNTDEALALTCAVKERETLMDLLNEAVIYTDSFGNITYCNKCFRRIFHLKGNYAGKNIQEVIPHQLISEYYNEQVELNGQRFYFESTQVSFYGIISSKRVCINGVDQGVMLCLRTLKDIVKDANLSQKGSLVTFQWASWLLPREVLDQAKQLAVTSGNILIHGKNRNINEILAKSIANYSERSLNGLKAIYCDNMYRELFEVFLFDEFGELMLADNGTILIQDVENLPLYIQERLLCFLKTGKISLSNQRNTYADVRFIFSTATDLREMVKKGYFLEELCLCIMEDTIEIPGIQENEGLFYNILESAIHFYREKYHKYDVSLSRDAMKYLWDYAWNEDLNLLESKLETIVRRNNQVVTRDILEQMGTLHKKKEESQSLSGMERDKILELLNCGFSKTEIARKLGIGRATLYRKLTEYSDEG